MTSPSRWRSEGTSGLLAAALALGSCEGRAPAPEAWAGEIAGESLPEIVDHVAARDHLDPEAAEARVLDTLRLATARREARASHADDPEALLAETRRTHLLRTARARLWLEDVFERTTGPAEIPDEDIRAAAGDGRLVHPELHLACQYVVAPAPVAPDAPPSIPAVDQAPEFWARAERALAPIVRRTRAAVVPGDPKACEVFSRVHRLSRTRTEGEDMEVRIELLPPLHLDACAEAASDGSCARHTFAEEWVDQVRGRRGFVGPFRTRFGLHFVWVADVVPGLVPEAPDFEARLRQKIHAKWQREELGRRLARLREARAVRVREGAPASE